MENTKRVERILLRGTLELSNLLYKSISYIKG